MLKELQQLRRRRHSDEEGECCLLSTSRSFGDVDLKVPKPLVIAEPELRVVDLVPEDWAILLGCDGVFDVLSDQEVADIILQEPGDAVKAAKLVVENAIAKSSKDNITAVVLRFGWSRPPIVHAGRSAAEGETLAA